LRLGETFCFDMYRPIECAPVGWVERLRDPTSFEPVLGLAKSSGAKTLYLVKRTGVGKTVPHASLDLQSLDWLGGLVDFKLVLRRSCTAIHKADRVGFPTDLRSWS